MKSAIVTGANGFVGRYLVNELSRHDVTVYAVVRDPLSSGDLSKLPGVHVVGCDMEHIQTLVDKIPSSADVFYHLAWSGSTGAARGDYALQLTNTRWTLDSVNTAKQLNCKKFIGAGTLAEYDVNAYSPKDGSTPNAVSCYGVAKIAAHYMSKAECCRLGIEHMWAYLSNTYGIGNYTSNFVNFAAKTLIVGQPADFTSGEQPYDFVHVNDTAQGLYCIGARGKANCSYYIGSTHPKQLKDFILQIRDAVDPRIKLNLGAIPFRGIALPAHVFDCSKLVTDTGYQPQVAFEIGIKSTVSWIREQIEEGKL